MPKENDLSEYEKIRLANINRNAEFLLSIGFSAPASVIDSTQNNPTARFERRKREEVVHQSPTKRSRRLLKQSEENSLPDDYIEKGLDDSEDNVRKGNKKSKLAPVSSGPAEVDYGTFPQESESLDDFEFKNYAFLRAWRAGRCRDLDVQAYKICQNRTLCEIIRRRRNDPKWGKDSAKFTTKLVDDLLECWGIGPSKTASDGFGFEILEQMEDADVIDNFCNSRKLGDIIKLAEDEDLPVVTALDVTEIEATPAIQQTYLLQPV